MTFDRELLAIHLSIRHFRHVLEGRRFYVATDHKPIVGALGKSTEPWSPLQARQLSYISEFTNDIRYCPGKENTVADFLSRDVLCNLTYSSIDLSVMSDLQKTSSSVQRMSRMPTLSLQSRKLESGKELLVDVSTGSSRPLVPEQLHQDVLEALHGLSHPGVRATKKLVSSSFV